MWFINRLSCWGLRPPTGLRRCGCCKDEQSHKVTVVTSAKTGKDDCLQHFLVLIFKTKLDIDTWWNVTVQRKKKRKGVGGRKHSTSCFSGTGKRHGLEVVVVVSGMALWENSKGGNTAGCIVMVSIPLHRNTFIHDSGHWSKSLLMLCGQQMSQVWC